MSVVVCFEEMEGLRARSCRRAAEMMYNIILHCNARGKRACDSGIPNKCGKKLLRRWQAMHEEGGVRLKRSVAAPLMHPGG